MFVQSGTLGKTFPPYFWLSVYEVNAWNQMQSSILLSVISFAVNDSDIVFIIDYTWLFFDYFLLYSGFPVWLKYVPGISFRTDNEPFKVYFSPFLINWFLKLCSWKLLWTFTIRWWSLPSVVLLVSCSPDGNATVHPENCTNDEERKAICLTRWPHYPFPGMV